MLAEIERVKAQLSGQASRADNHTRAQAMTGSLAERVRSDQRPLPTKGQRFYNTAFKMPGRQRG